MQDWNSLIQEIRVLGILLFTWKLLCVFQSFQQLFKQVDPLSSHRYNNNIKQNTAIEVGEF